MPLPARLHLADCDAWDPAPLRAILSREESDRAARYRHDRDRGRFIVRRGLLRGLLGAVIGRPPAEVPLGTGPAGKPLLVGAGRATMHAGVNFNLAHSAGLALYAVLPAGDGTGAIGVDLEAIRPERRGRADLRRVAGKFAAAEAAALERLPADEAVVAFHRLWAVKEACLKCLGTGIGGGGPGIAEVVCTAGAGADGVSIWRAGEWAWAVRVFEPRPGLVAAVARPAGEGAVPAAGDLEWIAPPAAG